MNSIIKQMLSKYNFDDIKNIKNPFAEVLQKVILYCLNQLGFYKEVVFQGGTCLRIIHGLNRFSEDLDFSVLDQTKPFDLNKYIEPLIKSLKTFGLEFTCSKLDIKTNVNKCVLSINLYDLAKEYAPIKFLTNIRENQKLKIKFEIDTNPPAFKKEDVENVLIYEPSFCVISVFNLSTLFAGKLNAIITRQFSEIAAKGRDYYDYLFYLSKQIKPNLSFLQSSLGQFKIWNPKIKFEMDNLVNLLTKRFLDLDIESIKKDVSPLIKHDEELNVWSVDFFLLTLKDLTK